MTWCLDTAKTYLGIDAGDTSQDELVQNTMDYSLAAVEDVLQRRLLRARETVTFHKVSRNEFLLPRYPVRTVYSVVNAMNQLCKYTLVHNSGQLSIFESIAGSPDTVVVDYDGGYEQLPTNLERTMWEIFMTAWSNTDQTTGGPPATGGGGVIVGSGDVKSLTVFDGFKMDFDVGTTSTSSDTAAADAVGNYGWLAPWYAVLDLYRSESGVGLGMA